MTCSIRGKKSKQTISSNWGNSEAKLGCFKDDFQMCGIGLCLLINGNCDCSQVEFIVPDSLNSKYQPISENEVQNH